MLQSCAESDRRPPSEIGEKPRIQRLAGRAVRLRRVPRDRSVGADDVAYAVGEFPYRQLFAAADVHEWRRILYKQRFDSLGRQLHHIDARGGDVVTVQELAARRAGAPQRDLGIAALLRFMKASDQRRKHMTRVQIVSV